jgi:hypothetical protein
MIKKQPRAENRKYHIIYKTVRTDGSGKYYIGMHSTDNLDDDYLGSGQILWRSIKKYGREMHRREILEVLPSRKDIVLREAEILSAIARDDLHCMNVSRSIGYASRKPEHPSASEKRRQSIIAFYASPESQAARQKISEANLGRKVTAKVRANMSAAAKARMARMQADGSWEVVKSKNATSASGKKQSAETIAKRVAARNASRQNNGGQITFSDDARANIAKAQLGNEKHAKNWGLEEIATGARFVIRNRSKWLRENSLVLTRDGLGIKRYKEQQVLYRLESL